MAKLKGFSLQSFLNEDLGKNGDVKTFNNKSEGDYDDDELAEKIQATFAAILENGVLEQRLYWEYILEGFFMQYLLDIWLYLNFNIGKPWFS